MTQLLAHFALAALALCVVGCGPGSEERYDVGYDDGYASGYNATCKIRATLIEGAWDDKDYSRGYHEGYADGERECKEKRDE